MERYLDRGLSRKDSTVTDGHLNTWQTEKPKRLANAKAQRGTERGPERTAKSALRKLQQDELAGSLRGGENVCAIQGFTCLRHRTMLSRSLEALREESAGVRSGGRPSQRNSWVGAVRAGRKTQMCL